MDALLTDFLSVFCNINSKVDWLQSESSLIPEDCGKKGEIALRLVCFTFQVIVTTRLLPIISAAGTRKFTHLHDNKFTSVEELL